MGYLRGYTSFTKDSDWPTKLLLTSLCLLIAAFVPIVTQAMVMGWTAMAMRHAVLANTLEPLPRFELDVDYLVQLMLCGLKQLGITLLWMLPAVALVLLITVPLMIAMTATAMGDAAPPPAAMPCLWLILLPILLLLMIPAQVALLRIELCDQFSAGFAFREIFSFSRLMFVELVLGLVLVGTVGVLVSIIGLFVLCIGIFPAQVLVSYSLSQCRAYIYECYLNKGGEPWEVVGPIDGAYPQTQTYRDPAVFA